MKLRHATLFAMAAALSINAATVMAQGSDSTRRVRSTTRIPVTKESPGEVTLPRVDTVMVYRTDTVTVYRTDTLTVTRVDTLRVEPTPPPVAVVPQVLRQIGGFVSASLAAPRCRRVISITVRRAASNIDVPFGFDPIGSPIGVRFDAGYSRFDTQSQFESPRQQPGDHALRRRPEAPASSAEPVCVALLGLRRRAVLRTIGSRTSSKSAMADQHWRPDRRWRCQPDGDR
jgi:hypothetical protein